MQPRTVLLIDHHTLWRVGLVLLLRESWPEATLHEVADVDEVARGVGADALPPERVPELILVEPDRCGAHPLTQLRRCRDHWPGAKLVVMLDREAAPLLPAIVAEGVDGLMAKTASPAAIVQLLRERLWQDRVGGRVPSAGVIAGYAGPGELPIVLPPLDQPAQGTGLSTSRVERDGLGLSVRQMDVLRLLSAGLSNKAISQSLGLAESTVKTHVLGLFQKLGLASRTEAALWAASRGLVQDGIQAPDAAEVLRSA